MNFTLSSGAEPSYDKNLSWLKCNISNIKIEQSPSWRLQYLGKWNLIHGMEARDGRIFGVLSSDDFPRKIDLKMLKWREGEDDGKGDGDCEGDGDGDGVSWSVLEEEMVRREGWASTGVQSATGSVLAHTPAGTHHVTAQLITGHCQEPPGSSRWSKLNIETWQSALVKHWEMATEKKKL